MSWVKLDDQFWSNKKVRRSGDAIAAYCRLLSWCGDEETDGQIPDFEVDFICSGLTDPRAMIARLVTVQMIEETEGGYAIPDYLEFNFSRAQLEEKRETDRIRKENQRRRSAEFARKKVLEDQKKIAESQVESEEESRQDTARTPQGVTAGLREESQGESTTPVPTRPDPTRPVPKEIVKDTASEIASPTAAQSPVVDKLVRHLLDRYAFHAGTEALKATPAANNDMRLLLERGPTTWATPRAIDHRDIGAMIDWVFDEAAVPGRDGFCWANNVRSPGSLREKWDQLTNARKNQGGALIDGIDPGIHLWRQLNESQAS